MASKTKSTSPGKKTKAGKSTKPAKPAAPVKKKSAAKKPVAAKARHVAAPPPAQPPRYRVALDVGQLRVVTAAGPATPSAVAYDSFHAARMAAVESLVELIERCERRLHQLRRAASFEQYLALLDD